MNNDTSINRLHALHRIAICLAIAVSFYFFIPFSSLNELAHIMLCWDIFSFCLLAFNWYTFFSTDHRHIREQARDQDGSRVFVFAITLICTFASLLAVIILLISKSGQGQNALQLAIAIGGMISSWLLVHTTFAYRYAHAYYGNLREKKEPKAGGLEFPEEVNPNLLDFAYFSFVLGMTFQVSDVSITSSGLRKLALFHGLISFAFNTTIIALTINVIAGLTNS